MNEAIWLVEAFGVILGTIFFALRWGYEGLVSYVVLLSVCANFFVLKQVDLFGLTVTVSDVFMIGVVYGINLIQEGYGKDKAREAVNLSWAGLFTFTLFSQIHVLFVPSACDVAQGAYVTLLGLMPRITAASLTAFYLTQRIDVSLFALLRRLRPQAPLSLRTTVSIGISQTCDTLLFTILGLYGVVENLIDVVVVSLGVKALSLASLTLFYTGFSICRSRLTSHDAGQKPLAP